MNTDLYAMGMRARNAIYSCFFLLGFLGLAWIPRIPEIKDSLNLSDGQFGLVLLASTVGSIPGAQIAGRAVHSYSSKLVVRISGVLLPVGVFVIGMADTVQILLLGLFITGFNVAFMDIAINGQAVEIEKHTKGRWMSSFHGFWSIGAFAATLVGGLIANFVSPRDNLIGIAVIGLLTFQFIANFLLPAEHDGHRAGLEDLPRRLLDEGAIVRAVRGPGLQVSEVADLLTVAQQRAAKVKIPMVQPFGVNRESRAEGIGRAPVDGIVDLGIGRAMRCAEHRGIMALGVCGADGAHERRNGRHGHGGRAILRRRVRCVAGPARPRALPEA